MMLCANCHAQTENWGGRGVGGDGTAAGSGKDPC